MKSGYVSEKVQPALTLKQAKGCLTRVLYMYQQQIVELSGLNVF